MSEPFFSAADLSGLPEVGLVIVGFSGGADSTALAHWLTKQIPPERIVLAHVNHMLRGEEADRDEAAARAFAQGLGLRFALLREDVKALAEKKGLGLEECGRKVRYGFFQSLAAGENDRVLTAHNAEDNVETMLLNLCRGTGPDGLCGIPRRRGKILRPLLHVSREEIEAYCAFYRLSYVVDSSNLSGAFSRNRLRLEVLPVLRELNPRFSQAFAQAAELLEADGEFLEKESEKLLEAAKREYGLDADTLQKAESALSARAVKLWLESLGCGRLEKKHLDAVTECLWQGGAVSLPGGITVRRAQGTLSAFREREAASFFLPVELGETPLPGGKTLILEKKELPFAERGQKIHNLLFKNALDYDIITGTLIARSRREGDRFSPPGRNLSKSLKQVFQECGIPPERRKDAVLLECGGVLAFCEGAGASQGFQVTEKTRRALFVTVRRKAEDSAPAVQAER